MGAKRPTETIDAVGLDEVRSFWSSHPCDSDRGSQDDWRAYFQEIEDWRYSEQSYIPQAAQFSRFSGRRVLEIGCGVGTDGRQFAASGAVYTGVNLDDGSVDMARRAFDAYGLPGEVLQMNAEELQFEAESFDHVYSMGVIMATPHPERLVAEALRVLTPGGTMEAMVYNRSSINYWIEIMFLRRMLRWALLPGRAPRIIARVTGFDAHKLERHREILLSGQMTKQRWISINTDGPDCPLSDVYTAAEAVRLFQAAGFSEVTTFVRFFNKFHYSYLGRLIPGAVADALGRRWGWHLWVIARKPLA